MLTLAGTSIIGTLIPQNESPMFYFRNYGEFWYKLFYTFNVVDMYHSGWFQILLILLTINIIVCSFERLSATWKIIFVKKLSSNISRFRNLPYKEEFKVNNTPDDLKKKYEPIIARNYRERLIEEIENGFCIFAEKGRWTRVGVYIVHISVIFLLIGGLIGSLFGFEGFVNIPEGNATNQIQIRKTGKAHSLDFEIQCDDFNVSYYGKSTMPKEYRSSLTILENSKSVLNKDIIVNDPLRYKGINIFQSSFGKIPLAPEQMKDKEITLNFTSRESELVYTEKSLFGKPVEIPEGLGTFVIKDFKKSYDFRGHDIGETFIGQLTMENGIAAEIPIPLRHPNFDKMRGGSVIVSITDFPQQYYTGLQVTKDPGVWIVYIGFIVMIAGIFITFFMSHQTICVEITEASETSKVMITGTSNKNKMGMESKIRKLAQQLGVDS